MLIMGIRGLTTFIENRSHLYMDSYELHDTKLVIDGNSIACQIYKWHTSSNDCFGGDYDKYGKAINDFFDLLAHCNVTPYVVLDGGYESRKVATVIGRTKNKIRSANLLSPVTEGSVSVFPLFLKKTFEDVVNERGLFKVRCDFEGDTETANIARALDCPILSYDSDYFIFDTLYIPFATFEMALKRANDANKKPYKYISCKVYRVDKFLKSFEGLQKSSLPILAVLLGNDYVKRGVFTMFYHNLKIEKCRGRQSDQQNRIKSLLIWLQNETIESALKNVLSRYKKPKRKNIMNKIEQAIKGYNSLDSKYLTYLNTKPVVNKKVFINLPDINIEDEEDGDLDGEGVTLEDKDVNIDEEDADEVTVADISGGEEIFENNDFQLDLPIDFLEKFRKCVYPDCFMDILIQNKYYCVPQVDDSSVENTHVTSFDILSAIHKILTNGQSRAGLRDRRGRSAKSGTATCDSGLICIGRKGSDHVGRERIPLCEIPLPKYDEINSLTEDTKISYILRILDVDIDFYGALDLVPKSWHVFLLTINYYLKKTSTGWPVIYSLVMCKLVLGSIDKKVGYYRSSKILNKKFGPSLDKKLEPSNDGQGSLENISKDDCISSLKTLITCFEMEVSNKPRTFDRHLVHSISQFQSCLLHVGYLNILFDFPLENFFLPDCLNCTFIYNLAKNFNKRIDVDEYIKILLKDAPSVLYSFQYLISMLREHIKFEITPSQVTIKKKRKKKKKVKSEEEFENITLDSDEDIEDVIFDPNNKFAVLGVS